MSLGTSHDQPAVLWTPRRLEQQIERLHARHVLTSQLYDLEQSGVSLAAVTLRKREVARLLAKTLTRGEYEFAPASVRRVLIEHKERTIFSLRLTDLIVHGVITDLLQEAMAPRLSSGLYSYRKGRSWWSAIADFASYVRTHRRERPDPRQRGLYVLRRDVQAYTDSIPVGERSPMWRMLRAVLASSISLDEQAWRLIVGTVRPEAYETNGRLFMLSRGVPTGLPIACALFNLYLEPLDEALHAVPGAFYARYSDDVLFAHPSADVVQAAGETVDRVLHQLDLSVSDDKRRDLYLTAAGRRSSEWLQARPAMAVPLLGCRIAADGSVSLSRKKVRRLLREVEHRVTRTAAACAGGDVEAAGHIVCAVVNRALMRRADPFRVHPTDLLRRVVTDRRQLQQLDYWIARIVLRVVARGGGARGFRRIPYRRIRHDWKLRSLVHARNRWGRGGPR